MLAPVLSDGLRVLREKLLGARHLPEIADQFFDLDESTPSLMEASEPWTPPEELLVAVGLAGEAALDASPIASATSSGEDIVVTGAWFEVPGHSFMHGMVTVQGKMGSALYFEKLDMGVLILLEGPGGLTHHVRFRRGEGAFPAPTAN